jgi:hypothetical protein
VAPTPEDDVDRKVAQAHEGFHQVQRTLLVRTPTHLNNAIRLSNYAMNYKLPRWRH